MRLGKCTDGGGRGRECVRLRLSLPSRRPARVKVVAFVDMDAFYVEVERRINPDLVGHPVAVVQYNPFEKGGVVDRPARPGSRRVIPHDSVRADGSIIAISYEGRARGVKRIMRGAEAVQTCPDLRLVGVPTKHGKADLTIYRDGGLEVLDILKEFNPSGAIEKASVDESYADLTQEVWSILAKCEGDDEGHEQLVKLIEECKGNTHVAREEQDERERKAIAVSRDEQRLGHTGQNSIASTDSAGVTISSGSQAWWDRPLPTLDRRTERTQAGTSSGAATGWTLDELCLAVGASILSRFRKEVRARTGFSCSGGVSLSRRALLQILASYSLPRVAQLTNSIVLAKLCGGLHKPNQQTLAPPSGVDALLRNLPLDRLFGLGGALGREVQQKFSISTAGELASISESRLRREFPEKTAAFLVEAARGSGQELKHRSKPKTISCGKTFWSSRWGKGGGGPGGSGAGKVSSAATSHSLKTWEEVRKWLRCLAVETCDRVSQHYSRYKEEPSVLRLGISHIKGTQSSGKDDYVWSTRQTKMRPKRHRGNADVGTPSYDPEYLSTLALQLVQAWAKDLGTDAFPLISALHMTSASFVPCVSSSLDRFLQPSSSSSSSSASFISSSSSCRKAKRAKRKPDLRDLFGRERANKKRKVVEEKEEEEEEGTRGDGKQRGETQWACRICTLLNEDIILCCKACGTQRPTT